MRTCAVRYLQALRREDREVCFCGPRLSRDAPRRLKAGARSKERCTVFGRSVGRKLGLIQRVNCAPGARTGRFCQVGGSCSGVGFLLWARVAPGADPTKVCVPQDPCALRKWADPKIFASNRPLPVPFGAWRSRQLPTDPSERPREASPISRRETASPLQSLSAAHRPFGPDIGLPRAPQGCPRPTGVLTPPPRPTQARDTSRHTSKSQATQPCAAPRAPSAPRSA